MRRTALLLAVVSVLSVLATLFLWFVLLKPSDPASEQVPFATFTADVAAGKAVEVRIHDTVYRYRTRDSAWKQANGPEATIAMAKKLASSAATNIVFDE
jgi:hypothetical protein